MSNSTLVKHLLLHANKFEWSLQGLGMLRLYVSDDVRLHVWDSRYRVPNVSPIHTHPWDFESEVISGIVVNTRYTLPVPSDDVEPNPIVMKSAKIRCGENAELVSGVSHVWLNPHEEIIYSGQSYRQDKHVIHKSDPFDGTVTLCKRHFSGDRDHARVFWTGDAFVSAAPRPATSDQVAEITQLALSRWTQPVTTFDVSKFAPNGRSMSL